MLNDNFPLVPATRAELLETLERALGVEPFAKRPRHRRRSQAAVVAWNAEKNMCAVGTRPHLGDLEGHRGQPPR